MKKVLWAVAALVALACAVARYRHRNFGDLETDITSPLYHLKDWIVAEMEGVLRFIEHPIGH